MSNRFSFLYFIYGCWLFFSIKPIFTLNGFAEESLKINLNQELKQGNLLIGLKQYLGVNSDSFSEKLLLFEPKCCFNPIKKLPFFNS